MVEHSDGGIRHVQIFGERCSGTNFLRSLVSDMFRGVQMTKAFGGKHWYIRDHQPRGRPNETTDQQCVRRLDDSADTLFLVIHRNPYDWLRSLQRTPYHAWTHDSLPLQEFVTKPWVSSEVSQVNPTWSIRDDGYYFIEEAANVLELRALKLRHLLGLEGVVPNVAFVRYDHLAADPKSLTGIADRFGIDVAEDLSLDVNRYFGGYRGGEYDGQRKYDPISDDDLAHINAHLDWDVESACGYSPADYTG